MVSVQQEFPENKSQCLSMDRISALPLPIIETILCLISIQDAVRTSILSKKWRYNWTKIPKLVFNEKDMFDEPSDEDQQSGGPDLFSDLLGRVAPNEREKLPKRCKVFYAIYQVLLMHQGPIHEFSLTMEAVRTNVEIDQIITYLSRHKTFTKLTLDFPGYADFDYDYYYVYRIPLSIFSLHHLTELSLHGCILEFDSPVSGLRNLTSLSLIGVRISEESILPLLSSFPSLKRFTLNLDLLGIYIDELTWIDLLKCLPRIEHLSIDRNSIKYFAEGRVPRERKLPTILVHLKYICISDMILLDKYMLPFLTLLIRSAPNLEKIKLEMFDSYISESEIESDLESEESDKESETKSDMPKAYSGIRLENLKELEIEKSGNYLPELEFVKIILAKSPLLKKVKIVVAPSVSYDGEMIMLKALVRFPRASPVVEILAECPPYKRNIGV